MENKKLTALEALYLLYTHEDLVNRDVVAYLLEQEHLAEYYNIVEKELKALEIIKLKQVNIFIFLYSSDLETYNDMVEDDRKLTQQEFDLLKEVLL